MLNKLFFGIFICLFFVSSLYGLSTAETPLFDLSINARDLALGKASHSDNNLNNMSQSPSSILGEKGLAMNLTQFLGIDYASIVYVNQYQSLNYGMQYMGASVDSIRRTVVDEDRVDHVEILDNTVPYGYHTFNIAVAQKVSVFDLGIGYHYTRLVLDDTTHQHHEASLGIGMRLLKKFKLGFSARHIKLKKNKNQFLDKKNPVLATSIIYYITSRTTLFMSLIENKNETKTNSTFHYSMEHYFSDYVALRAGLDHNRVTVGAGLNLNSFKIDLGWAQSRSKMLESQWMLSFTYLFDNILI